MPFIGHELMHPPAPHGGALAPPLKCYGEHVTVAIWLKNLHPVRVVLHVAWSCGGSS